MNTPNDPQSQETDEGETTQQRDSSIGQVSGTSVVANIQGYNNGQHASVPLQSYGIGVPQQKGMEGYHTAGVSIVNPIVTSSHIPPTPLVNVTMPNQAAVFTYMQQQQQSGTNNMAMGVNPYAAFINNPFVMPVSSVPNPLQYMNTAQFVGQNSQWQATVASGTTSSYSDGKDNGQGQHDPPTDEDDRVQTLRDRNRVHARSARQRKKAYVHQLQSLVENLHTERNEEIRKQTMAAQRAVDMQKTRRRVMVTFLNYHSQYQTDPRKWLSLLEDTFWLKQPITPFRSFRRNEIEKECRVSRGLEAVIYDAASLSVMLESIGCYSSRWARIKREKFLRFEESKRCPGRKTPSCAERQDSRLQHAISSLSGGSDSTNHKEQKDHSLLNTGSQSHATMSKDSNSKTNKVSSSSGGSGSDGGSNESNEMQNYHNKSLQDRKKVEVNPSRNESTNGRPSDESQGNDSSDVSTDGKGKHSCSSDLSSSENDSDCPLSLKRRKSDPNGNYFLASINLPTNISSNGIVTHPTRLVPRHRDNIVDVATASHNALLRQPSVAIQGDNHAVNGPHLIATDTGDGSSDSDDTITPQIKGQYHFNDDDIMILDDVSMCPFVFRSHNAVLCGAMAECVLPGMLRARFSDRNKLLSIELVYDAMGFMQQLERASGSDISTQIIPGSLDMALSPSSHEARVITLAQPPYLIVNVNEVWTRVTGFTQIESEGIGYLQLLEGDATVVDAKQRPGKPIHLFDSVAKGQPACSTNIHYDSNGRDYVEFVCSYPLTNSVDEVTHILHVSRELPSFDSPIVTN